MKLDTAPSTGQMFVSDGTGQIKQIIDPRGNNSDWPIAFTVPAKEADSWIAHLDAEVQERGWSGGGTSSLRDIGNAGGLSFAAKLPETFAVQISWEKHRDEALSVVARSEPIGKQELGAVVEFLNAVQTRHSEKRLTEAYVRMMLTYEGLPWRGEVWLTNSLRLGPPSKYSEYLLGSNFVVVDTVGSGIGLLGANAAGRKTIQELRIFLCVLLGDALSVARLEEGWRSDVDPATGAMVSTTGTVGYVEELGLAGMPERGRCPAIARRSIVRPGVGDRAISIDETEKWVPADLESLWQAFTCLSTQLQERFLKAGNLLLAAHSLWPEHRTGYAAFHVVACEALKPHGKKYEKWTFYDVVEGLLGPAATSQLKQFAIHPQKARNQHFHKAGLFAGELLTKISQDYFKDPSFDNMTRELVKISRICLIEWLRKGGDFGVYRPISQRPKPNVPNKSSTRLVRKT